MYSFSDNVFGCRHLTCWLIPPNCTNCSLHDNITTKHYEPFWFPMPLHWRHNDHDDVSNHQPHGCLLNRLFKRRSKKTSKLCVTGLCVGNSPGPVNSPHKGPVTRKMFPFDDVIMPHAFITNNTLCKSINWNSQYQTGQFYFLLITTIDILSHTYIDSGIACKCSLNNPMREV